MIKIINPVNIHSKKPPDGPLNKTGYDLYNQQWFNKQWELMTPLQILITTNGSYKKTNDGFEQF